MGKDSAIEWTDHSWNPWVGCLKVSPGCKQCYMYRDQKRFGNDPGDIKRTSERTFYAPLRWQRCKVFTCSWSDFFLEQADPWRGEAWEIMRSTISNQYLILTKRPENIFHRLPKGYDPDRDSNLWFGVSVESPAYLWRIDELAPIPASRRFISYEPAIERVNFSAYAGQFAWLISGGESGYTPRPSRLDWFRDVRDFCLDNGIAYFHKQHGGSKKYQGTWGGRLLDNVTWDQFPKEMT